MNYFQVKTIKRLSEHKNAFFYLAFVWTIFIAVLCLVSFSDLPKVKINGADKYVHFTLHFVFTILWFCYLKANKEIGNLFLKVLIASIVYGIIIEICQETFTSTRHADIKDVMANSLGSIVAIGVMYFWPRRFKN